MIKLVDLLNEDNQIEEAGVKDIALGAAMAASSIFGGAKAQSKIPTDKPAITQQANIGNINPKFWINDTNDIKSIQKVIKAYRLYSIANWKKGKEDIKMSGQEMDPNKPEDVSRVGKNYMLWCLGTSEDGKNGKFTSQFEFPGAFLKDLNSGKVSDLGLEGNDILSLVNSSQLSVMQMAEWNNFVKWMKDKGYSGKEDMDHVDFRDNVLQQYKGQVKEHKMTKQELREAIRKIIKRELNESLTEKEKEEFDHIEDELRHKAKTKSAISKKMLDRYKELKAKKNISENAPAPSKPKEKPGPAIAPGKPGKKEGPRRPLGNPNVKPAPKAIKKATMEEASMLAQIVKRFKSKK